MSDPHDYQGSPWVTKTPWVLIAEEERVCDFHGPYTARCYKAVQPRGWEDRMAKMSQRERSAATTFIQDWWTKCSECNRLIHDEQVESHKEAMEGAELRKQLAIQRAAMAGIPERYAHADPFTMKQFHPKMAPALRAVRDYCNSFELALETGRCIALIGHVGTGKTHSACAIANYVMRKGGTARYTTVDSMLEDVKATYHEDAGVTERQVVENFTKVDLLAIDEIGRSTASDHTLRTLRHVLDTRYRHCRPTVLCSNVNKAKLRVELGDAIYDRLREGGGKLVVFDWESLRAREDLNE